MRLETMEKIDEGKDKKHTGNLKLTDNSKDRTPYICVRCDGHRHAAVLNLSE